ncbi:MAG: hypothetical protein AAFR75_03840, partial [Pseudomonadota bacterium]
MDMLREWAMWLAQQVPAGPWRDQIYAYCERGSSSAFWAEPLNAFSNGAFHVAAILSLIVWVVGSQRRVVDLLLIALVVVIGTGSF